MLELYSGRCTHGHLIAQEIRDKYELRTTDGMMKIPVHHISVDTDGSPTLKVNALGFTDGNIKALKAKFPNCKFIILASPPCQNYSKCNTTGVITGHTLALSDQLVGIIRRFEAALGSILTIIENPATGKLPNRDVIKPWQHRYIFDYCRFGGLARKRTMLFCSKPLLDYGLYLPDYDQETQTRACHCLGGDKNNGPTCASMYQGSHHNWDLMELSERQSIPKQLSVHIAHSICEYLERNMPIVNTQTRGSEIGGRFTMKPDRLMY